MCSGERSSSANGAIALRQSCARSWSISRSRVLSDWTIRGPSFTWRVYGVGEFHRPGGETHAGVVKFLDIRDSFSAQAVKLSQTPTPAPTPRRRARYAATFARDEQRSEQ